ncbi:MAG: asparagine synthase (glutamine-hydrolyzing) [Verrucomicrobiota bacterium]
MCGIVGAYWRAEPGDFEDRLRAGIDALHHRGPDDRGDELIRLETGLLGLGHTRLSILDLSEAGHQPMVDEKSGNVIVFNGEIYNYRELGRELGELGCEFRSTSDTEVLLKAWSIWGRSCVSRLVGMFAFAVYDRAAGSLTLVRDGFGIKPLYYSSVSEGLVFASEQEALLKVRGGRRLVDLQRSYEYLLYGEVSVGERTFIEGVKRLLPGHMVTYQLGSGVLEESERWWRPSIEEDREIGYGEAVEETRARFLDNIRLHLRSDVPVSVALSGGVDSSATVCAMRQVEPDIPIHTFSYIAEGSTVSEEKWVDEVNGKVGAIPHKVVATGGDLENDLSELVVSQGEPFVSTSVYAQYLVFQKVNECGFKVILDGQGADELLAGYYGYPEHRIASLLERGRIGAAVSFFRHWKGWPGRWEGQAWKGPVGAAMPVWLDGVVHRLRHGSIHPRWLRLELMRDRGVKFRRESHGVWSGERGRRLAARLENALTVYGLPTLLGYEDRNSMRVSVESRVPFLTTSFADFLLSLPEEYLISPEGETKRVFRSAMRGIVPDSILDRRDKIGFATPEKEWFVGMEGTIRGWLREGEEVPFLEGREMMEGFDRVLDGRSGNTLQLWRWINFVRWYQGFGMECS